MGYELHPDTPAGGVLLSSWLPNAEAMLGYVHAFAARFGIPDLAAPARLPNTRRALAVAEFARDGGRLDPFRAAAFDAYWRGGHGLEDDGELAAIALAVPTPTASCPSDEANVPRRPVRCSATALASKERVSSMA